MANSLEGKRVLVTGGTGFIGGHLVLDLLKNSEWGAPECAVLDLVGLEANPYVAESVGNQIQIFTADLSDYAGVLDAVAAFDPNIVFHLAAYTNNARTFDAAQKAIDANIVGTVNLLRAVSEKCKNLDRFVNVSTNAVYGAENDTPFKENQTPHPPSPYSASKYCAELFCNAFHKTHEMPIVNIRPFNPYGPFQRANRIIPYTIISALMKKEVKITGGEQTREFNHVSDIVRGLVLSAIMPEVSGRTMNLGSGQEIRILDLVSLVLEKMGNPVAIDAGNREYRSNEIWKMYCDNTLARKLLGWEPEMDFDAGLNLTIEWYRTEFAKNNERFMKLLAEGMLS